MHFSAGVFDGYENGYCITVVQRLDLQEYYWPGLYVFDSRECFYELIQMKPLHFLI
jgi:hypothetical protein